MLLNLFDRLKVPLSELYINLSELQMKEFLHLSLVPFFFPLMFLPPNKSGGTQSLSIIHIVFSPSVIPAFVTASLYSTLGLSPRKIPDLAESLLIAANCDSSKSLGLEGDAESFICGLSLQTSG